MRYCECLITLVDFCNVTPSDVACFNFFVCSVEVSPSDITSKSSSSDTDGCGVVGYAIDKIPARYISFALLYTKCMWHISAISVAFSEVLWERHAMVSPYWHERFVICFYSQPFSIHIVVESGTCKNYCKQLKQPRAHALRHLWWVWQVSSHQNTGLAIKFLFCLNATSCCSS